jgi:hypothetical protein
MKRIAVAMIVAAFAVVLAYSCSSDGGGGQCGLGGFSCAGNKAYTCGSNGKWTIEDCSKTLGTTCVVSNKGAKCEPLTPGDGGTASCGLGGFMCDGNKAYNCNASGQWNVEDCSKTVGLTCELSNQGARCTPLVGPDGGTAECGLGGFKCEGNKAYNCGSDYKWVIKDCSATVGTTCVVTNEKASCEALTE